MPEFSLIIPVYNAEKTLHRCLDSIQNQTFCDFEVIMINDGSVDHSAEICRQYCEKDARFHLIYQKNGGPSKARNNGLKAASGEWICFVDSDDSIDITYLEKLKNIILTDDPDIVFIGYHAQDDDGNVLESYFPGNHENRSFELVVSLSQKDMFGYTWIKVFRRKTIQNRYFPEKMFLFEDEVFTCNAITSDTKISLLNEAVYYHTVDQSFSLIGKTHVDYCRLCEEVYKAWEKMLKAYPDKERVLLDKANIFTSRCIYYGLERDVDLQQYFQALSNTTYFKRHTKCNKLDSFIRKNDYRGIFMQKMAYKAKNSLSKLSGRIKR